MALKLWTSALLPLSIFAVACGDDVGECEDPIAGGYDTVLVGSSLQYGGQAIMNTACAQGCHSSDAKDAQRNGAPAGLDFDLRPLDPNGPAVIGTARTDAGVVLTIDPAVASGLRARQRKIFEDRQRIWQQVKDGLMPPDGKFAYFRSALKSIFDTDEDSPCTASGAPFPPITDKRSQDVLRIWLACGAPIVETTSEMVMSKAAPGTAGYQYPACEGAVGEDGGMGGTVITIETLHARFFSQCTTCHSAEGGFTPDLETPEKAYAALVQDQAVKCGSKPYVSKGMPEQSYFLDLLSQSKPQCTDSRMPPGGALSTAELRDVTEWIRGGALRQADVGKSAMPLPLPGGLDAGTP